MPVKLTEWRLRGAKLRTRMHRLGKDFLSFLHLCHPDLWGGEENQLLLGRLTEKRAVIRAQSRNRETPRLQGWFEPESLNANQMKHTELKAHFHKSSPVWQLQVEFLKKNLQLVSVLAGWLHVVWKTGTCS